MMLAVFFWLTLKQYILEPSTDLDHKSLPSILSMGVSCVLEKLQINVLFFVGDGVGDEMVMGYGARWWQRNIETLGVEAVCVCL